MRRATSTFVLFSLFVLLLISPAVAQEADLIPYIWEDAGLTVSYPAGWDEPLAEMSEDGRLTLSMAQILVASPDTRPPGMPAINLTVMPPSDPVDDLTPFLEAEFNTLGMTPAGAIPSTLLGGNALSAEGASADGLLFGLSRVAALPDGRLLLMTGRAPEVQRAIFASLFDAVVNSLTLGIVPTNARPIYGVVWNTTRTLADGETAFITLTGAAYRDDKLYAVDVDLGVVKLDAKTGRVLATHRNPELQLPSSIAIDSAGIVYVSDVVCQCIHILDANNSWRSPMTGFDVQSPTSILVAPDDTLYATELTPEGIQVRLIAAGGESVISFGPEVVAQPLLSLDNEGRVLALTPDRVILVVSDEDLAPLATLNIGQVFITDFAVDADDNFVLATDGLGILIVSPEGEPLDGLGRIVANFPLPGEFVHPSGVVVGEDDTIYVVDSDGTFGSVTAMNRNISAGRVGSTVLVPGVVVQGLLDDSTTQQDWILSGAVGQTLTISAIDATGAGVVDVGLELIAPDGSLEASNDDQAGADLSVPVDAQIADHVLAAAGDYTVRVTLIEGAGLYHLGIVQELSFTLDASGITELQGEIEGALPKQRWTFEGAAGQVFTVTMGVTGGTLDPLLRLLDSSGAVLAENDDATDVALGKNAQLVQVTLPADGLYMLEATRFEGEGTYDLVIAVTA